MHSLPTASTVAAECVPIAVEVGGAAELKRHGVAARRALPKPPERVTTDYVYREVLKCALLVATPIALSVNSATRSLPRSDGAFRRLSLCGISGRLGGRSLPASRDTRPTASSLLARSLLCAITVPSESSLDSSPSSSLASSLRSARLRSASAVTSSKLSIDSLSRESPLGAALDYRAGIPGSDMGKPLSKEFLHRFHSRMAKVACAKAVPLSICDPVIAQQLALFAATLMKQRAFKKRLRSCPTVAFLASEFLVYCGQLAAIQPFPYVCVLRDEAIDCLRYQCTPSSETSTLVEQFTLYSDHVQSLSKPAVAPTNLRNIRSPALKPLRRRTSRTAVVPGIGNSSYRQSRSASPFRQHFKQADIASSAPPGNPQRDILCDMDGLLEWVHRIFGADARANDLTLRELQSACTPKVGIEDYKRCLAALAQNCHPVVSPKDFPDSDTYRDWRAGEEQQLKQLIACSIQANPDLLPVVSKHNTGVNSMRCYYGAVSYAPGEDPAQPHYICIPELPIECYRITLHVCIEYERREHNGLSEGRATLSAKSTRLLRELAIRWRIGQMTRDIILLDCLCDHLQRQQVAMSHLARAVNAIEKNLMATVAGGILLSDRRLYYQVRVRLNRLLHQYIEDSLDRLGLMGTHSSAPLDTIAKAEIDLVVGLLERLHSSDDVFRSEHLHIHKLVEGAVETKLARSRQDDRHITPRISYIEQLRSLVDAVRHDMSSIKELFPGLLVDTDIAGTALSAYLKHANILMSRLVMQHDYGKLPADSEGLLSLYCGLRQLQRLGQEQCPDAAAVNVCGWFRAHVITWLEDIIEKVDGEVQAAIEEDSFETVVDLEPHSSSVDTILHIFEKRCQFLNSLEWDDKEEYAVFVTRLSKMFSQAVETYTTILTTQLNNDVQAAKDVLPHQMPQRRRWFKSSAAVVPSPDVPPNAPLTDMSIESCMLVNNIEVLRQRLDRLYYELDVDELHYTLENSTNQRIASETSSAPSGYLYTVKVVLAEDVLSGDASTVSGVAAVLQSGEMELARTRPVPHTLDPHWDETFMLHLSVAVEVQVSIILKGKIGKLGTTCGTAVFRLQPSLFSDYLAHDLWLELKPQGRLLVRVSMEGEKDDIRFHFGKAFRTLKRTQDDMIRTILDKVTDHIRHYISADVLLRSTRSGKWFTTTDSAGSRSAGGPSSAAAAELSASINAQNAAEAAVKPLVNYLQESIQVFAEYLHPRAATNMVQRIWKEILHTLERLLVPALASQPVKMRRLTPHQLDIVYCSLEALCAYFRSLDKRLELTPAVLHGPRYRILLLIRELYPLGVHELIEQYQNAEQTLSTESSHTSTHPMLGRGKSLVARCNIGTIRRLALAKRKQAGDTKDRMTCILRLLRLYSTRTALRFLGQVCTPEAG